MSAKLCKYTYFYIHDHLGSTSMVLDVDGNISQSVTYIPYGEIFVEERNGAWNSPYLFNSKELDEETGLYYYGARYLNPTNGMWLSVDPLFEKYVGMSPYQYCNLNPLRFVDPTGMAGHEVNIETGDITWIDDLTEDNVAEGFMYVPAEEMLNEVEVVASNTERKSNADKNFLSRAIGYMSKSEIERARMEYQKGELMYQFIKETDAVSLSFSVSGYCAGGGEHNFELGYMFSSEKFFGAYTSKAGIGRDFSFGISLNRSTFSGDESLMNHSSYSGSSYFVNASCSYLDLGFSRSFDGRWNTQSVGLSFGPFFLGGSTGCQETYATGF